MVIAAAVAMLNGVGFLLREVIGTDPGGPASSAFGTANDGYGALARLAERGDRTVVRLRAPLDAAGLAGELTLIVAEPTTFPEAEVEAARAFVVGGGRLIAIGEPTLFQPLIDGLTWSPSGTNSHVPLVPPLVLGMGDIATVDGSGSGSWDVSGPWLSVLGTDAETTVAMSRLGDGTIIAVADAGIWTNERLDEADNAAFALGAFGPGDRPVVFAEAAHGHGVGEGIGAAPTAWRWTAGLSLAAVLVLFWSRARAFGPPDRDDRELEPPRRLFAESLALTLARTPDRAAATDALRRRGLTALARHAGSAGRELDVVRQAASIGLTCAETTALTKPPADDAEVVALGRLVARLETPPHATRRKETP